MSSDLQITGKQQEIFDYIRDYQLKNGSSPTFSEIKDYFKFSSLNSVFKHLNALEKKGFITKSAKARGIELLSEVRERLFNPNVAVAEVTIPFLGTVPAGSPSEIQELTHENISINSLIFHQKLSPNIYLLKVSGDSMDLSGIHEGDYVVVDVDKEPQNFDIVVALVDNSVTLKRYLKNSSGIVLVPESSNPKHKQIKPSIEASVQGVVKSCIRVY